MVTARERQSGREKFSPRTEREKREHLTRCRYVTIAVSMAPTAHPAWLHSDVCRPAGRLHSIREHVDKLWNKLDPDRHLVTSSGVPDPTMVPYLPSNSSIRLSRDKSRVESYSSHVLGVVRVTSDHV